MIQMSKKCGVLGVTEPNARYACRLVLASNALALTLEIRKLMTRALLIKLHLYCSAFFRRYCSRGPVWRFVSDRHQRNH
ncbi:MAG: hypothetical protein CM15mP92_2400 [Halieaceae bacterium]|nr:MAG: hypothetical protein CM15mP92_2400 [Halieaceae bacterium]